MGKTGSAREGACRRGGMGHAQEGETTKRKKKKREGQKKMKEIFFSLPRNSRKGLENRIRSRKIPEGLQNSCTLKKCNSMNASMEFKPMIHFINIKLILFERC